jgi:hypothetical protein
MPPNCAGGRINYYCGNTMWSSISASFSWQVLGNHTDKVWRVSGKFALKDMMKDEPVKRNLPTVPAFKRTGEHNVVEEKQYWVKLLNAYPQIGNDGFLHPFFGHLTKEQTGRLVYKHADHHLRQFNA